MNFIAQTLEKKPENICKKDILDYIKNNKIKILNLCYIGSNSRLNSVSFSTFDISYIDAILSRGERIASVFLNKDVDSEESYIVPKYKTAFLNPFSKDATLNILCSCFNKNGELSPYAPSTVLEKAAIRFTEKTGLTIKAAGELEYFVIYPNSYDLFKTNIKQYHSTSPFTVWEDMRNETMNILKSFGMSIKYAHSECGKLYSLNTHDQDDCSIAEQHEIEFLPVPICDAGDDVVISKWVICNVAKKYGMSVTFSPVLEYGNSGNGLHFHFEILKSGKNIVLDKQKNLTIESKRAIGGMLKFARSLCAVGNPSPVSYLRLGSKKDSPHGICWGKSNRKMLIRIPMGWRNTGTQMATIANPCEKTKFSNSYIPGQTIEFRSADGMGVVHLLLAGLTIAMENGFKDDSVLDLTEKLHITDNNPLTKKIKPLSRSCQESAKELEKDRKYYETDEIFPPQLIDSILLELKSYKNSSSNPDKKEIKKLIEKYIHYSPFSFH